MAQSTTTPDPLMFFFSYRRDDSTEEMEQFLSCLTRRVAEAEPEPSAELFFHDQASKSVGDYWNDKIIEALSRARVLVAVYTPKYFARYPGKCYPGREFGAFFLSADGASSRILPILWTRKAFLDRNKYPPETVRAIDFGLPAAAPGLTAKQRKAFRIYNEHGLRRTFTNFKQHYSVVVDALVDRIVELADEASQRVRLSDIDDIEEIPCVFHQHDTPGSFTLAEASPGAIPDDSGPSNVIVIYCATSMDHALEEVAIFDALSREELQVIGLRWNPTSGKDSLISTVNAATSKNQLPLLIVPGSLSEQPETRSALQSIAAAESHWVTGIVYLGEMESWSPLWDKLAVARLPSDSAVKPVIEELLLNLQKRMSRFAPVKKPATGNGPSTLPRL